MVRIRSHVALVLFVYLLASTAAGCGLLFTHGPPLNHEQMRSFVCTDNNGGPVVDLVFAGLFLLGTANIASNPDKYTDAHDAEISGFFWTVLTAVSGAVGLQKVRNCQAALVQLAQRTAAVDSARSRQFTMRDIQSVVVSPATDTMRVGQLFQLRVDAYASSGSEIPDQLFTWSSSNEAIASVSKTGLVTANEQGRVVVAASTNNVTGIAIVVVTP